MTESLGRQTGFVGVDVSEGWFDVHLLPDGEAEHNRARRAEEPAVLASIEAHPVWLRTAIAELEGEIGARLESHPAWQERAALLASVPGSARSPWRPCWVCCPSSANSTAAPSPRRSGSRPSPATAA